MTSVPFTVAGLLAFLLTSLLPAQTVDAQKLRQGRELMTAGKIDEALAVYEDLVRESPDNPALRMNLAIAQFKAGRHRQVIENCERVLRIQPDLLTANLFLGAGYVELGEPAKAVEPLEKVLAAKPEERNARILLAGAQLALERYDAAILQYRKSSELSPASPAVWYGLGQSLEGLAHKTAAELAKSAADSAFHAALTAEAQLKQKLYGAAFRNFRLALAQQPPLRGLYAGLTALYHETGHEDWATLSGAKERALPPPDCARSRADCDFTAGRYWEVLDAAPTESSAEALYWTSRAAQQLAGQAYARLAQLPPSAESHELAARELDRRGRNLDAAKEWRQAILLSPQSRRLKAGLAWSLYLGRDHEAAMELLDGLLREDPNSVELNFLYGASLANMEQFDKAVPYLEKALSANPNFLPARAAIGQAYLRIGKAEQAIPHLRASLSTDDDGSRHYQLVRAYQALGRQDDARQELAEHRKVLQAISERARQEQGTELTAP
jgi:tetratricopeptide (TPR) repeat protein